MKPWTQYFIWPFHTMTTTATQQRGSSVHAYEKGEPLMKRRRVALACSACRTRKSRCDGRRPECSTCTSSAIECVYEPSESSTNVLVRKEYVSDLEQRLKDVERVLQRHDDLLMGHLSACSGSNGGPVGQSDNCLNVRNAGKTQDGIHLDALNVENPGSDDTKTDGLALEFVDEETPVFYGNSSTMLFTRCLLEAISVGSKVNRNKMTVPRKETTSSECSAEPLSQQPSPSVIVSPRNFHSSLMTLPLEEEMEGLLSIYFNVYGSLFPFLHEPTFSETYNEYKAGGFVKARKAWLGVLNMTFAMATHIDQSAEVPAKHRFQNSYVFFQRAVSLCSELSMRTVSLDIVQYLLLATLYLQGTQRPIQTWAVHGMLVRTAMALGLHSEQPAQGLHPIQQEIRRRTWLTIYCLDKIQSVTCGRPPAIPDEYIVVKMPSPWFTTTDMMSRQVNDMDIHTAFLDATVRLLRIVGRSVATQYGLNLGHRDQEMDESTSVQAAGVMRQELRRWAASLPSYLAICETGSESIFESEKTESSRMRVILTLRYHFVNILIHRPLLCTTLRYLIMNRSPVGSTLPYRIQLAMAEAHECILSAGKTIKILHTVINAPEPSYTKLDVWFFTLFHVFNSALVIIGCSVLDQHGVFISDSTVRSSVHSHLTQAVEVLDKLDKENRLVHNCARFIQRLYALQSDQDYSTTTERFNPRSGSQVQLENEGLICDQISPSFGFPALPDLGMHQFPSAEVLGHSFGEFGLSLEQLHSAC